MTNSVKITIVFEGRKLPVMTVEQHMSDATMVGRNNLKDLGKYINDLRRIIGLLPKFAGASDDK